MSTQTNPGYLLMFRGNDWTKNLSPEKMQEVVSEWMSWFKGLTDEGKALAGSPLEPSGKIVSKGGHVLDGPFAESKESIGGYFLLDVASMDEAVEIARQCPGLPYGARVEVRPVASECPMAAKAQAALADARA
jgi:hypothetical protein